MTTHPFGRSALVSVVLFALVTGQGCVSPMPSATASTRPTATTVPTLEITEAPTLRPTAVPTPTPRPWRVDVVNGPRRVIVSVATDRGAGLWVVEPGASVTLFEQPEARPGGIEIIQLTETDCVLLDKAFFEASDFTIVLTGEVTGPYTVTLEPGATLPGSPSAEPTAACSG